jgi:hypothetical protein
MLPSTKYQVRKVKKKEKRKNEGKKKKIVMYVEVPILVFSPLVENAFKLPPSCDPP